jgi:hypothetical protein
LRVFHVKADSFVGELDAESKVLSTLLVVILRNLATNHRQVSHCFLIIFVLFKGAFETLTTGSQVILFPVDVAKSIPSFSLCGLQLNSFREVLFSLLGVFGNEIKDFSSEVEQMSFHLLVIYQK